MSEDWGTQELVRRCLLGEEEAWREFLARYGGLIKAVASRRLSQAGGVVAADVEDVFQGVLLRLLEGDYRRLRSVRDLDRLEPWLGVVTANVATDLLRARGCELPVPDVPEFLEERFSGPGGERGGPAREAHRRQLADALGSLLGAFPPRERFVLTSVLVDGRSYQEVADLLGVPVGTVSSLVSRGKERLRNKLARLGFL